MVRSAGQALEDVGEVGQRLDVVSAAGLQDRVEDGGALSGVGVPDEEPVLGSQLGRADGLLGQVGVYSASRGMSKMASSIFSLTVIFE